MARRKLKPRCIQLPPDKYWLTKSEIARAMGYSDYMFRRLLPVWYYYRIPQPVLLGPDQSTDIRFRLDQFQELHPHLNPQPGTDWLTRFKAKSREDALARKSRKVAA